MCVSGSRMGMEKEVMGDEGQEKDRRWWRWVMGVDGTEGGCCLVRLVERKRGECGRDNEK